MICNYLCFVITLPFTFQVLAKILYTVAEEQGTVNPQIVPDILGILKEEADSVRMFSFANIVIAVTDINCKELSSIYPVLISSSLITSSF